MSYSLDVVAGEFPSSYEDAVACRDRVTDERDAGLGATGGAVFESPSDAMRELHRRLTARFPCIVDDPDGPWSDGPLINDFGERSATLGISFSRVAEVLPFLIATALAMGFWVLDAQGEQVYLPGGTVLRPRPEARERARRPG